MSIKAHEGTPSSLPRPPHQGAWAWTWYVLRLTPRMPAVWFMRAYRRLISPLYGDVCKYYPSCSKYALDAFEVHGLVKGSALTAWRILRCNPFSHGGVDHIKGSVAWQRSRRIWSESQ